MGESVNNLPKGFVIDSQNTLPQGFTVDRQSQPDDFDKYMGKINSAKEMSTPEAWLVDIGAQFSKVVPNLKRLVDSGDSEATAQLREIEKYQDILRTAHPSALWSGGVALPGATAAGTIGIAGKVPALAAGAFEAASLSSSESDPKVNAAIATALPYAPQAIKKAGSALLETLSRMFHKGGDILTASPRKEAGRALSTYMDESGINPEDVLSQRQNLGSESVLADTRGMEGISQGTALTPPGRTYAPQLESRQMGQQNRIGTLLQRITGKHGNEFAGDLDKLLLSRKGKGNKLYNKAWKAEFIPSEGFPKLIKRLKNSGALKKAQEIAKVNGVKIDFDNITYKNLHSFKEGLDDVINAATKKGNKNKVGALKRLKDELLEEIESNNPSYKTARTSFSDDSALITAAEVGESIFNANYKLYDGTKLTQGGLKKYASGLNPDEFLAFQGGMVKAVSDKLAKVPDTADSARRIWSRPEIRERIKLAFNSEKQFNKFIKGLGKESAFTNTLRTLYQGSQTAMREAGKSALKTGNRAIFEPVKKILSADISHEALQELSRLMFDKRTTNKEIRQVMIEAGIISKNATAKKIASIKRNWESIWRKINHHVTLEPTSAKAAISSKYAQLEDDE